MIVLEHTRSNGRNFHQNCDVLKGYVEQITELIDLTHA